MRKIITSVIVGVLFISSEAGPNRLESPCPDGKSNIRGSCETSQESCQPRYYYTPGQCKGCPCNNHEKSCKIDECSQVRCNCRIGYSGKYCQNNARNRMKLEKPLQVIVGPVTQTVYRDFDEIELTCIVNDSDAQVTWLKNRRIVTNEFGQHVDRILRINKARDSDGGSYICLAIKEGKSFKALASIEVVEATAPVARITPITDGTIKVTLGEPVELICNADGLRSNVSWHRIPARTSVKKTNSVTSEVHYHIMSMSEEQEGEYVCYAQNPMGSDSKSIRVVIEPLVLEVYPGKSLIVMQGQSITLDCRGPTAYPNVEVHWGRENNKPVASNVMESGNGSLTMMNIKVSDQGQYKCSATYKGASASATVEIVVITLPVIEITPSNDGNITVKLGDTLKLTCDADGHPQPNVQWQKFSDKDHTYEATGTASLSSASNEISSFSEKEAGLYLCSANNSAGSSNRTVRVVTKLPALKVCSNVSGAVLAGESVILECHETAGYSDMKIAWTREDGNSLSPNIINSIDGSLLITNITLDEATLYKCSATNRVASTSETVEIEVKTLPAVRITPSNDGNITVKLGDTLKLTCGADGHPQPNVQWQKSSGKDHPYEATGTASLSSAFNEITSFSEKEAGLYLCSANNSAGSSNRTVRVVTKLPALKVCSNVSGAVLAGESVILECHETAGYSDMKIAWTREDGNSLSPNIINSIDGSLLITNITLDEATLYKCSATNRVASTSETVEIEVKTLPAVRITPSNDGNITVKLGDSLKLTCDADGHPQPNVQWQKSSGKDHPYEATGTASLSSAFNEITSFSEEAAGLYLCSANNSAGSSNRTVRVVTKLPALQVSSNVSGAVLAGESLILECHETAGYSDMKIAWTREDGNSLSPNSINSTDGSLLITNITLNEATLYKCSATNRVAFTSETVEIKVKTLPAVRITPSNDGNITVKLGDTLKLTCEADGHPQPNVQWQKSSDKDHPYEATGTASLSSAFNEITSFSEKEAGLYLCSANNSAGSSNRIVRVVTKLPALKVSSNVSGAVLAGESVILECHETAGYSNMTIVWTREDGKSLSPNIINSIDGSLLITNITLDEATLYKCSATNRVASTSETVEIEVKTLPAVRITPSNDGNITVKLGDTLKLTCGADGHPQPNVQWQKSSGKDHPYEATGTASLSSAFNEITSFSEKEAGLYLCSANNSAGSSNRTVRVVTKLPALKVCSNVSGAVLAGESVILECHETAGYSDMKIAWTREDGNSLSPNIINSIDGSLLITNITLDEATLYKCSATNRVASTSETVEIEVKTLPAVRITPSNDGNITVKLGDSLKLTCDADGHPQPNVQWQKSSGKDHPYEATGTASLSSAFNEITSFSEEAAGLYLCSANNSAGSSNRTVRVVTKLPALQVSSNVSGAVLAGESLILECHETAGYSDMKIAWTREDGNSLSPNSINSTDGSLLITNITLNEATLYKCSATNRVAFTSETVEIKVKTLPAVRITPSNDGNITVKLGDTLKLTCEADGHPQPNVQWQKSSDKDHPYEATGTASLSSAFNEITSFSEKEAGLYLCSANNSAGSSNRIVRVVTKLPALKVSSNVSGAVLAGESVILECHETAGYSNMTIVWTREDGKSLSPNIINSIDGSLLITNITLDEATLYKCSATNRVASTSETVGIEVKTLPAVRITPINDGNITVKLGDTLKLTCEADGHPQPNVQWQKSSDKDHPYEATGTASLSSAFNEITSFSEKEAGLYLCSVNNSAGSSNRTVRVVTKLPALKVSSNVSGAVLAGESVILECHETAGYSDMKIAWTREDGNSLSPNSINSIDGSLLITNITLDDATLYKCSATNRVASTSETVEIEVKTLPAVRITPSNDGNITVKLGDSLKLTCDADGHPQPNVQWQKSSGKDHPYEATGTASLSSAFNEITSFSEEAAGLYLCSANNSAGSSNRTVRVVTKLPALQVSSNVSGAVLAGESLILECHETAGYSDMKIAWTREDGNSLSPNSINSTDGSLLITNITLNEATLYKCSATNRVAFTSETVEIKVKTLPAVRITPSNDGNITVKLGDSLKLTCDADGHPQPNVQWQKSSGKDHPYEATGTASLSSAFNEITSFSEEAAGLYLCSANNSAGSSNRTVRVVTKLPALQVSSNVSGAVLAGESVILECHETAGYSNMTIVWTREDGKSLSPNIINSIDGSLLITNITLDEATLYKCSATNRVASTSETVGIEVKTLPAVRITPINDGNITVKLGDTLKLTCEADGHPQPNVQWQKSSDKDHPYEATGTASLSSAFNEITSFSEKEAGLYLCSVNNSAGSSNRTVRVVTKLPALKVSSNVSGAVLAGESVILECHETAGYSDMKIAWTREDGNSLSPNSINSIDGSLLITNITLDDATLYKCSATNRVASTSETVGIEVKTLPAVRITPSNDGNITLKLGDTLKLTCEADGHPQPNVQWQKSSDKDHPYEATGTAFLSSAFNGITSFSEKEAGLYLCSANNSAGSSNRTVRVVTKLPALKVSSNVSGAVLAGESVILECHETAGYSNMTIVWTREDGKSLSPNIINSIDGSLLITNITLDEATLYKCSATNRVASTSETVEIEVKTLPAVRITPINDGNITVKLGDTLKLTCEADGHPQPNVQWQKSSDKDHPYEATGTASLSSAFNEITSFSEKEAGLYLCSANNSAGSSNRTVRVVTKLPALKVSSDVSGAVLAGESVILECHETAGYSDMKIAWTREDGNSLSPNSINSIDGSLLITNITLDDATLYKCSATNRVASTSKTVEIEVKTLAAVRITPSNDGNITVKLGDTLKLTCGADGHPQPNVQWQKSSGKDHPYEATGTASLSSAFNEITSFSEKAAGLYLCSANNSAGSSNRTVRVVTKLPALKVSSNFSGAVLAGESVILECHETAGYSNMTILWTREDGKSLSPNSINSTDGSLLITNITLNEATLYKCSATNRVTFTSETVEIKVKTLPAVRITPSNDGNITVKLGDTLKLTCEADGHPQPNVQWQKSSDKDHPYEATGTASPSSAFNEITSFSEKEAGLYLCSANNSAGSSNRIIRVVTKLPALKVSSNVSGAVLAGESVILECHETAGYSNMTIVWTREDGKSLSPNIINSIDGSLLITNITLDEATLYKCSATNRVASTSETVEIEVKTLPAVRITPSNDGNITVKLGDSLKLTCDADGHPRPNVQWQKSSGKDHPYEATGTASLSYAFNEITSFSEKAAGLYLCSANNSAGSSNRTVRVVTKLPALQVSSNVSGAVLAGESVILECHETAGYSDMKIAWTREDGNSLSPNSINSTDGSLLITNITLNEATLYKCSATNRVAFTSETVEIKVKTLPAVRITPSNDGNITVKLGDTLKLTCEADGHPQPNVQWQKSSDKDHPYEATGTASLSSAFNEITSFSEKEAGLYLCSANNSAGSSNRIVRVVTKLPALKVSSNVSGAVLAGESVILECHETAGYSNMTIVWTREDGKSLSPNIINSIDGSLLITNITLDEATLYKCSATNRVASTSETVEIEIKTLPAVRITPSNDGNITVKLGDSLKLTCDADGHSQPNVQWQKSSGKDHPYEATGTASLSSAFNEITSFSEKAAGLYLCSANNSAGSSNRTVRVVTKLPALKVSSNVSGAVLAGESVILECHETAGYSDMEIAWTREDGNSLSPNIINSIDGSLLITNITLDEATLYKCSATNRVASTSETVEIEIKTLPAVRITPSNDGNITVKLGDSLKLTCDADGHSQPNVQWQKSSGKDHPYEATGTASLSSAFNEITSFSEKAAGLYLCSANNSAGSSNRTVRVVTKLPALQVSSNVSGAVLAGESVILECHETAGYSHMTIVWTREDGKLLSPNIINSIDGSLLITNITLDEATLYKCSATNRVASTSETVEIEVETLPAVRITPSNDGNITVKLGDTLKLTCDADGHPQPNVQWQKFSDKDHTYEAPGAAFLSSASHEISSFSGKEAGLYLCSANNSAGSSNRTVRVVTQLPVLHVHSNVTGAVVAGRSVMLECHETAGYSHMTIDWKREDGKPLAPNIKLTNGSLLITNITIKEEGRYKCLTRNGVAFSSATLNITVEPSVALELSLEFSSYGAKFTCHATGKNVSYKWTAIEGPLIDNEVAKENVLSVNLVTWNNYYSRGYRRICCEAFNHVNSAYKCKEYFEPQPFSPHYSGAAGSSGQLTCALRGPEPRNLRVKWKRADGLPLPKNAIETGYHLKVPAFAKTDSGTYKASINWSRGEVGWGNACTVEVSIS